MSYIFKPRPSFNTWIDWAKFMYINSCLTIEEFEDYISAKLKEGDPFWTPIPGGFGSHNPWQFEYDVEIRAIKARVY